MQELDVTPPYPLLGMFLIMTCTSMHLSGLTQAHIIQWMHATNNTLTSLILAGTSLNKNHQATQCLKGREMIGYQACAGLSFLRQLLS